MINCPFCVQKDFDLIGLKNHFEKGHCDVYNKTISIDEDRHMRKYLESRGWNTWYREDNWVHVDIAKRKPFLAGLDYTQHGYSTIEAYGIETEYDDEDRDINLERMLNRDYYNKVRESGMFGEFYPDLTWDYEKDVEIIKKKLQQK